jgi:hypothetical protein
MPASDLAVAVARELGYQRTGARIRTVLDRVAQQMLRDGALTDVGGSLRLAASDS